MEAHLSDWSWPKSSTKITADAIELELPRPFGSLRFWKQIQLKPPSTKGPSQLQFNCVSCHFCGLLGEPWSKEKATSVLPSPLHFWTGGWRLVFLTGVDQRAPQKLQMTQSNCSWQGPLVVWFFGSKYSWSSLLPKGLANSSSKTRCKKNL